MRRIVPDHTALAALVRSGLKDGEIAAMLGCARTTITMARARYGIPTQQPPGRGRRSDRHGG